MHNWEKLEKEKLAIFVVLHYWIYSIGGAREKKLLIDDIIGGAIGGARLIFEEQALFSTSEYINLCAYIC